MLGISDMWATLWEWVHIGQAGPIAPFAEGAFPCSVHWKSRSTAAFQSCSIVDPWRQGLSRHVVDASSMTELLYHHMRPHQSPRLHLWKWGLLAGPRRSQRMLSESSLRRWGAWGWWWRARLTQEEEFPNYQSPAPTQQLASPEQESQRTKAEMMKVLKSQDYLSFPSKAKRMRTIDSWIPEEQPNWILDKLRMRTHWA